MSYRDHDSTLSSGTPTGAPWAQYKTGQLFKLLHEIVQELLKRFIKGEENDKPTVDFFEITDYPCNEYIPIIKDLEAFEMIGKHLVGNSDWKDYMGNLHPIFELLEKKIKWGDAHLEYSSFQRAVSRYLDAKDKTAQRYKVLIQQRAKGLKVLFDKYHVNY